MKRSKDVIIYVNPQSMDHNEDYYSITPLRYPFLELGPLRMHIPYHFAIVNCGEKLERIFPSPQRIDFEGYFPWADDVLRARLLMVHGLYRTWMACKPDFTPESRPAKQGSLIGSGLRRSSHLGNSRGSLSVEQEDTTGPPEGEGEFEFHGAGTGGVELFGINQDEEDEEVDGGAKFIKWLEGLTMDNQEKAELPAIDPDKPLVEGPTVPYSLDKGRDDIGSTMGAPLVHE